MKQVFDYYSNEVPQSLGEALKNNICDNLVIVCVGTDKIMGDALGPLVGTFLTEKNFPFPVYGTLDHPIHALNVNKRIKEILTLHKGAYIIAIDACIGSSGHIGEIHIRDFPIYPGKGVGKSLNSVGDQSIVGIIALEENMDFTSSIRLAFIYDLASRISDGLLLAYELSKK